MATKNNFIRFIDNLLGIEEPLPVEVDHSDNELPSSVVAGDSPEAPALPVSDAEQESTDARTQIFLERSRELASDQEDLVAESVERSSFSDKLAKQIVLHEGFESTVYKDTVGVPTIGVGFNLRRDDARAKIEQLGLDYDMVLAGQQTLSRQQAEKLAMDDIKMATRDAKDLFPNLGELDPVRQRVLIDMSYNLGKTRLAKFQRLRAAVERKDWDAAVVSMRNSLWFRQVKSRGVTLSRMMASGIDLIDQS